MFPFCWKNRILGVKKKGRKKTKKPKLLSRPCYNIAANQPSYFRGNLLILPTWHLFLFLLIIPKLFLRGHPHSAPQLLRVGGWHKHANQIPSSSKWFLRIINRDSSNLMVGPEKTCPMILLCFLSFLWPDICLVFPCLLWATLKLWKISLFKILCVFLWCETRDIC